MSYYTALLQLHAFENSSLLCGTIKPLSQRLQFSISKASLSATLYNLGFQCNWPKRKASGRSWVRL